MGVTTMICALVGIPVFIRLLQEALHWLLGARFVVHTTGVVLVTGSSTGIGHAIAVDLAKTTKLTVFASVLFPHEASLITAYNLPNLIPVALDVTSTESIAKCYETIQAHLKSTGLPFVGLVNNAGLGHSIPAEIYPMKTARYVFDVNFFGLLEMTQKFLPLLRESTGRIVNLSSFAGTNAFKAGSIYCGSKYAVEALSDSLRRELFGRVAVVLIEPAYVKSELMRLHRVNGAKVLQENKVDVQAAAKIYPRQFDEKFQEARHKAESHWAASPQEISSAVVSAFTSSQPYTRYRLANLLGCPTWLLIWLLWALPDSIKDRIL